MRCGGAFAEIGACILHALALESICDRGVHHQFGEPGCSLVQPLDGAANGVIILALPGFSKVTFQLADFFLFTQLLSTRP